jgi:hypothetical protein
MLTFPIDAVPVSGKFIGGYFHPDTPEGTADVVPPPVHDEPPWEDRMFRGYQQTTSLQTIAESIWLGDAIVGTNRSAANDHGTYSFVILTNIASESPTESVKCGGNLPNLAEYIDMDSHHPEAAALFSALCFIRLLLTKYPPGPTTAQAMFHDYTLSSTTKVWQRMTLSGNSAKKLQCLTTSSLTMTYFKESNVKLNHFQLHPTSNGSKVTKIITNQEMNYHSKPKQTALQMMSVQRPTADILAR